MSTDLDFEKEWYAELELINRQLSKIVDLLSEEEPPSESQAEEVIPWREWVRRRFERATVLVVGLDSRLSALELGEPPGSPVEGPPRMMQLSNAYEEGKREMKASAMGKLEGVWWETRTPAEDLYRAIKSALEKL